MQRWPVIIVNSPEKPPGRWVTNRRNSARRRLQYVHAPGQHNENRNLGIAGFKEHFASRDLIEACRMHECDQSAPPSEYGKASGVWSSGSELGKVDMQLLLRSRDER